MDQFKIWKGVCQDSIFYSAYLTYMQSTSCEMPDWMKHKLESRMPGKISVASDTTAMGETEGTEEPLDESERGE